MGVYQRGKSRVWWYRFSWRGELIRESTRLTNKREAEKLEAAHKARLARGEVGIVERKAAPSLQVFMKDRFLPYVDSTFASKPKTLEYYRNGVKNLMAVSVLADVPMDQLTADAVAAYVATRQRAGLAVNSINRELEVLRRAFILAMEWGAVQCVMPKVRLLSGGRRRERVLSAEEESRYLAAAQTVGEQILESFDAALTGIRATVRGEEPIRPSDPFLLRDATAILFDAALRPEECFRLRWEDIRDGCLNVLYGKTANARRAVPVSPRIAAILELRRSQIQGDWVFPAPTKSGHIEKSSLRKQHAKACTLAGIEPFDLYTARHTALTRWAPHMDPYVLAKVAGHSDFGTTRRYVHPQQATVLAAMEKARSAQGGHKSSTPATSTDWQAKAETTLTN